MKTDAQQKIYDGNLLTAEEKATEGVSYSYNPKDITEIGLNTKGEKIKAEKVAEKATAPAVKP